MNNIHWAFALFSITVYSLTAMEVIISDDWLRVIEGRVYIGGARISDLAPVLR